MSIFHSAKINADFIMFKEMTYGWRINSLFYLLKQESSTNGCISFQTLKILLTHSWNSPTFSLKVCLFKNCQLFSILKFNQYFPYFFIKTHKNANLRRYLSLVAGITHSLIAFFLTKIVLTSPENWLIQ